MAKTNGEKTIYLPLI